MSLLFICLGNICRSPAAHAVMQAMIKERGLDKVISVDSAGIGDWHVGQLPDERMRRQGAARGYVVDHRARQFRAEDDFDRFGLVVVMDEQNYKAITALARTSADRAKVVRLADYFTRHKGQDHVPDPYYGTADDFDYALTLIEDGCEGLLHSITDKNTKE